MITKLIELIKEIKDLRWWSILFIFIASMSYMFKSSIVRNIDLSILNKDIVASSLQSDVMVNRTLKELMSKTSADRAYIFRFHNGVQYYNGSHKSKMSCDYEVVARGVSREAEMLQDIPTALYAEWIVDVINYDMIIPNVEYIEDIMVRSTLKAQEIKALAVLPYYRNGNLFALIGVDYLRPTTQEDIGFFKDNKDSVIQRLKIDVKSIGDLLI